MSWTEPANGWSRSQQTNVSADEIEKTDTILAGVAYQLAQKGTTVVVLVSDTLAAEAIRDVLAASGHDDVAVIDGREFVTNLVETEF